MSRKRPNIESLTNELKEGSLFFQRQPTPPSTPQRPKDYEAKNERTTEGTNVPSFQPPVENKPPRRVIRHTFDVYHDQLIRLQKLQIAAMSKGRKKPKLGKMVQKAIDLYLKREERKTEQF